MINELGKFLRKLRIENDEILADMAKRLKVSKSFLSQVETGKKKPPREWQKIIKNEYELSEFQEKEFEEVFFVTLNRKSIELDMYTDEERKILLTFARKIHNMDIEQLKELKLLIFKE